MWKTIKHGVLKVFSFVSAIAIVAGGFALLEYYLENEVTFKSVTRGVLGLLLIFPAIKSWQDWIEDLF